MASMLLELDFPPNWYLEGEADLLWVDDAGAETHYDQLVQGKSLQRETYAGHRWIVRGRSSREPLANVVAVAQPSGGAGADAHGWGDVDLPAAPVGSVDAVVQANVERLAAQVSACGACGRALVRCERVLLHHDVGLKCTTPPAAETGGRYQHRPARQERIPQPRHS